MHNEAEKKQFESRGAYMAVGALLIVQVLYGLLPSVGKIVLQTIPNLALVGFRVLITAVVLFLIQYFRKRLWLQSKSDYVHLAILSLFGVTLNQLLFITGLSMTTAANTSLLAITIPFFTLIVGVIIGTTSLEWGKVLGLVVGAAGVILLIDPRSASFSSTNTVGDFLLILNSLSFGIYVATSKAVVTRNGAFRSIMWLFIFAVIICVPLGVYSLSLINISSVSPKIWLLIAFIAIFGTTFTYLLNAWALARVSPATVAVFIYLQPLIGFTLAVIFLGETIDTKFIAAAMLIFIGLYITLLKRSSKNGAGAKLSVPD